MSIGANNCVARWHREIRPVPPAPASRLTHAVSPNSIACRGRFSLLFDQLPGRCGTSHHLHKLFKSVVWALRFFVDRKYERPKMHTHANKPAIEAYSRETFDDRALYAGFVGCRELWPQLGPFL